MAKFTINASGAMLLPSLVQVSESISGSVVPLAMFYILQDVFFRYCHSYFFDSWAQLLVEEDFIRPEALRVYLARGGSEDLRALGDYF